MLNDELGLLAALIGTLLIAQGQDIADPIAAIVAAAIIAINAISFFRENACFLLGRSSWPDFLKKADDLALSVDGVLGIHELRAEYIGPDTVHLGMHIDVRRGLPIEEADRIADEVMGFIRL